MKFLRTIRGRLFASCACIVVALLLVLTALFYGYTAAILETRASESLQQLAININQYLDVEYRTMSGVALRVISSQPIKDRYYTGDGTRFTALDNQLALFELLFTVAGPSLQYQINIAGEDGRLVQFGKQNDLSFTRAGQALETAWFEVALQREGRTVITHPHESDWGGRGDEVVSVCRAMNKTFGARYDSVAEVQIPYRTVLGVIRNAIVLPDNQSNPGVVAFAYGEDGTLIYAPEGEAQESAGGYYAEAQAQGSAYGSIVAASGGEILAYSTSSFSGWTVVVRERDGRLLTAVGAFRNWVLVIGALALVITLGITFLIARQLTVPIREIQSSINRLELSHLGENAMPKDQPSTYELNKLTHAYQRMVARLEHSLNETVEARFQEMRARLLALQAQMDPHFLYNTITIISIKAENNDDAEVVALCENLTGMLRYVSKEAAGAVPMEVELAYLDQYLFLMESRYGGQFRIEIDIPEALRQVEVPKLILQPIIENCFKYAFDMHPPWVACIRGEMNGNRWSVTVTDNGKGFCEEALAAIHDRIRSGEFHFAAGETDRIGLLNIYYRLRFLYKDDAVFEVKNDPEGGSSVTIGGLVERRDAHEW